MHIASIITGSLAGTNIKKKKVQFRFSRTVRRFLNYRSAAKKHVLKIRYKETGIRVKHSFGLFKGKMLPFALWFSDSSATSEVKTINN